MNTKPDYCLVELSTPKDRIEEGQALKHAIGFLDKNIVIIGRFYSVRRDGERLLTLSCYPVSILAGPGFWSVTWLCQHIVGLDNRPPTKEEIEIVKRLLKPLDIWVKYDERAPY